MCSGSEAGSYLRLIDFCITQVIQKEKKLTGLHKRWWRRKRGSRHRDTASTSFWRASAASHGKPPDKVPPRTASQKCEAVPRRARKAHRLLYRSTLGLRVIKKRADIGIQPLHSSGASTTPLLANHRTRFPPLLFRGNGKRFRGGLVFKAHRLVYHSTLGLRVITKKKKKKKKKKGADIGIQPRHSSRPAATPLLANHWTRWVLGRGFRGNSLGSRVQGAGCGV